MPQIQDSPSRAVPGPAAWPRAGIVRCLGLLCGPARAQSLIPSVTEPRAICRACRALNQAVGRCLRHRGDYGAILLIDERFRHPRHQQHLSRWCGVGRL